MNFVPSSIRKGRAADLASLDIHIGQRLRWRRKAMGFSQERLGYKLGMSFQQVQKYENGTNSLSARRLFQVSQVMGVPITFFFDGYGDKDHPGGITHLPGDPNLQLVRACQNIKDDKIRKALYSLIKSMARAANEKSD